MLKSLHSISIPTLIRFLFINKTELNKRQCIEDHDNDDNDNDDDKKDNGGGRMLFQESFSVCSCKIAGYF